MIGESITLNKTEQRLCEYIAKCRYAECRKNNITNSKKGKQSNEQTELDGVGAEFAICKMLGIYPYDQMVIKSKSSAKGEDENGDVVYKGKRIDVKTTRCLVGHLQAAEWKSPTSADAYALMVGAFPAYTYRGCMKSEELIRQKRLGKLTKDGGLMYLAKQEELVELEAI